MPTLDTTLTIGQLVAERPSRSRVFEKLGIDFCCGGRVPLDQVCSERNLDTQVVVNALLDEADTVQDDTIDPSLMTLTELCDHIEQTHHAYLKEELPRLAAMTRRVASAHGPLHPWTVELHRVFSSMITELDALMLNEEQVLFPWIRDLEIGKANPANRGSGSGDTIANPIEIMEDEHDSVGNALTRMSELSGGYTPPDGACDTFIAMLDGLKQLEVDMHQHVHKENYILFRKAIAMEISVA